MSNPDVACSDPMIPSVNFYNRHGMSIRLDSLAACFSSTADVGEKFDSGQDVNYGDCPNQRGLGEKLSY